MSDFDHRGDSEERGSLSPEDDWFASVAEEPDWPEVPVWQDEPVPWSHEPVPPGLGRRQAAVALAVLVAVALAGAVIVGVRAIGGSGGGETAPATTVKEPTGVTTGPTTTPTTAPTQTDAGTTTTPPTTETAASAVPTDAVLRSGDSGDSVTALQEALSALGHDPGDVDGIFGSVTKQAVTAFQQSKGLTVDGIAGAETIAAINEALTSG